MEIPSNYVPQKYKWYELMFRDWRLVRKLSKSYWVKMNDKGYSWVKFNKELFEQMRFVEGTTFQIEDWTKSKQHPDDKEKE